MRCEWEYIKLASLGKIVTGKTPRTAVTENYGGEIPFLTPSDDLSQKHAYLTTKTLTKRGLQEVKNCLLPPDSVCVSCIGSDLGKVTKTIRPTVTNQQINSIIPKDEVNADFLYYAMLLLGEQLKFISKTSTAIPIVNKTAFSNYSISLPDFPEQKAIAAVLSALDDKIELNNRINKNLEAQAQAIFKSWFVDFEPFQDGEFLESELGLIPKGWSVGKISSFVSESKNGGTPSRKNEDYWNSNDVPWIKTGEILNLPIIDCAEYISFEGLKNSSAKMLPINSVLIALYGATASKLALLRFEATTNQACCAMICSSANAAIYLYINLLGRQDYIKGLARGSAQQNLSKDIIASLPLLIPTCEVICQLPFETLYNAIEKNIKQNRTLAALRDTLLPKLMSGEIRVPLEV